MISRRSFLAAAAAASAADSVSLFDGESTRGWRCAGGGEFPSHCWTIEEGCLKALVAKPTFADIRTVEEFGDFDFEFEWKISPNGNSGVKYLLYREDVWKPGGAALPHARGRGFEYQIAHGLSARKDTEAAGALYEFLAPVGGTAKVGEFNQGRIVRRGARIEHWLNGVRVVEAQLDSPEMQARMRERKVPVELPGRSAIVLQNHASEAWFRRLRLKV
ncbi:MAG: DUF1080 domain-containing protein [Bryobacteraceae bacterium]|nr:DUF1080 domain-containing protein [Bryobacteraceae bacterium]